MSQALTISVSVYNQITILASCYAPTGHIIRHVALGCEVGSGLQFGDSQVLIRVNVSGIGSGKRDTEVLWIVRHEGQRTSEVRV